MLSVLPVAAIARAQTSTPCPDEPGLPGSSCRVDGLGAGAERAAQRLRQARAACAAGHTTAAIRELHGMRRSLPALGDRLG